MSHMSMNSIGKLFPGRVARLCTIGAVGAGLIASCLFTVPASASPTLSVVGYSTLKQVYANEIAAFQKTPAGKGVAFQQSYAASGAQASAVVAGQPADVVNLSLDPDMQKLVSAGIVAPGYNQGAYGGYVTNSVVVFVVRKGNPKHITTWSDLVRSGVQVLTPNPFLSGAARWNDMAAYGAELALGKTKSQAVAYLGKLYGHVVAQDGSAAAAMADFLSGKGDVLLDYENDAIAAERAGDAISYVIPPETIEIQAPIAVTKTSADPAAAKAFLRFLLSTQGQTIFARAGYRPVMKSVLAQYASRFPTPKRLFTIAYVGGWTSAMKTFFTPNTGIMAKIEAQSGQSVQ